MSARARQKEGLSHLGEFGLIDLIKKTVPKPSGAVKGIGDDTAVIPLSSKKHLLLTTDMLLENVHFTSQMSASAIGYKALACSVSDIAAMGGVPTYAVVSLGVPASCSSRFVAQIYQGIKKAARLFDIGIVGGDTVKSQKVIINVALAGEVLKSRVVYRSGARPGDEIFVTGRLGGSLESSRHLRFIPRVEEAHYLVSKYKPNAMIDISDGLAADLGHIVAESGVGAIIDEAKIPKHRQATLKNALYDGEDFELLFTLSEAKARQLRRQKRFSFYAVGVITGPKSGFQIKTSRGLKELDIKGYRHF